MKFNFPFFPFLSLIIGILPSQLDLGSLKSVREFVDNFHELKKPLHVLCNNAGMTSGFSNGKGPFKTEDGFEVTFGINHLGKKLFIHLRPVCFVFERAGAPRHFRLGKGPINEEIVKRAPRQ